MSTLMCSDNTLVAGAGRREYAEHKEAGLSE